MSNSIGIALVGGFGSNSVAIWTAIIAVSLGLIALLFTQYRYVVGYFISGMLYWFVVESLHWAVMNYSLLTDDNAYILAVALSLLPIIGLLGWQPKKSAKKAYTNANRQQVGQRRFTIEKDTDYHQHYVRHASVTETEH